MPVRGKRRWRLAVASGVALAGLGALSLWASARPPRAALPEAPASALGHAATAPTRLRGWEGDARPVARGPDDGAAATAGDAPRAAPVQDAARAAPVRTQSVGAAGRTSASRARPSPQDQEALEEELRLTEDALASSRERAERAAGVGREPPAPPGSDAGPEAHAAAAHAARRCAPAGARCLASPECCAGLACAGGIPGFATQGRCTPPR